jgi:hypothetical protein
MAAVDVNAGASASMKLAGRAEDLLTLALLFPEGAFPDFAVWTGIVGAKAGIMDRVVDAADTSTVLTGSVCLGLLKARDPRSAAWIAREILAPLNGYAALADANFTPVSAVSAEIVRGGSTTWMSFDNTAPVRPRGLISAARHPALQERMASRVDLMSRSPLAAYAALVIAGEPSWTDYYRLLEDIAWMKETTIDKLHGTGLTRQRPLKEFTKAANNRAFARHGLSKRDIDLAEEDMMTLLEAREFVRQVVNAWLDEQCGDVMPRDRVDGPPLRFGLDDR